jgi:colanic acid biosynthesis glycosyl transferase WcaI
LKLLLLNQAFYPDVVSTAQHASDLAASLVRRGHDVTVVASRRAYDNPREQYPTFEEWHGVRVIRMPSFGLGKRARWRRAADFASYFAACGAYLAILGRFDLVLTMTSPPLISWLGALFVTVKGGKFAFWVMDLNPDEALAAGWLLRGSLTAKCLESMSLFSLHRADAIIALDRFMAERIERKGIIANKIWVMPPWSHDEVVRYDLIGRLEFRAKHGFTNKFVVMYAGNHSPCHPLTTLLNAAKRLEQQREILFCFVGGGSEFQAVKAFANEHGLENIVTLPYQRLDRLSASLSSADMHVVVMGDPFVGIVHPCKVYNIRTLGIPYLYIGPRPSHISDMNPCAEARHGDVEAVVASIRDGAKSAPTGVPQPTEVPQHNQRYLIEQFAVKLESLHSHQESREPQYIWQKRNEYW